jgi:hypothetical protein
VSGNAKEADFGAEMFGIASDLEKRPARALADVFIARARKENLS